MEKKELTAIPESDTTIDADKQPIKEDNNRIRDKDNCLH